MKNQIPGRRLDFEKIFWYNIKKTIFTRTGFRGVPVAYGVHPTGVTWVSGKLRAIWRSLEVAEILHMGSSGRKNGTGLPFPARFGKPHFRTLNRDFPQKISKHLTEPKFRP